MDIFDTKMVLVVRTKYPDGKGGTFKPRTGKLMGQIGHAVQDFFASQLDDNYQIPYGSFTDVEKSWIDDGKSAKIVCQVETLEEMLALNEQLEANGIKTHIVTDLGLTEFDGPTQTVLRVGPDLSEKINPFTQHLKLL